MDATIDPKFKSIIDETAAFEKQHGIGGGVSTMLMLAMSHSEHAISAYILENYFATPHFSEEDIRRINLARQQAEKVAQLISQLLDQVSEDPLAVAEVAGHC